MDGETEAQSQGHMACKQQSWGLNLQRPDCQGLGDAREGGLCGLCGVEIIMPPPICTELDVFSSLQGPLPGRGFMRDTQTVPAQRWGTAAWEVPQWGTNGDIQAVSLCSVLSAAPRCEILAPLGLSFFI